jgi:Cu(I)/Ag(I) efflux system membrane fusion protein
VDYVYPSLDAKTRTVRARLKFSNQDLALKPNMFAQISIHTDSAAKTIMVPKEAVIRTGKQDRVVLALEHGQFKSIAIKIGRVDDAFIEVVEGLTVDDVVVTSAQFLIDSESSKNSDFKRMSPLTVRQTAMDNLNMMSREVERASVKGQIKEIDFDTRRINISREAIEKWGRPAANVDFFVAENINMQQLEIGMQIQFTFEVRDDLIVVAIEPLSGMTGNAEPSHHSYH